MADDATPEGQRRSAASFWQAVGTLTSIGWLMAVPIAASILLGHFLDGHLGTGFFWTLTLLGLGVSVAAVEVFLALRRALEKSHSGSSGKSS